MKRETQMRDLFWSGVIDRDALVTFWNVCAPPVSEWNFLEHIFELLDPNLWWRLQC